MESLVMGSDHKYAIAADCLALEPVQKIPVHNRSATPSAAAIVGR